MMTLANAILKQFEICAIFGDTPVKEVVLQEIGDARCVRLVGCYAIKSSQMVIGKGKTPDSAWENAALRVLKIVS